MQVILECCSGAAWNGHQRARHRHSLLKATHRCGFEADTSGKGLLDLLGKNRLILKRLKYMLLLKIQQRTAESKPKL